MDELPIAAGFQIIDADLYAKDIPRMYRDQGIDFDSLATINEAIEKAKSWQARSN